MNSRPQTFFKEGGLLNVLGENVVVANNTFHKGNLAPSQRAQIGEAFLNCVEVERTPVEEAGMGPRFSNKVVDVSQIKQRLSNTFDAVNQQQEEQEQALVLR